MRELYFIREKKTNTWCYSSKHESFSTDFNAAAVFLQKENAEKAIRAMSNGIDPKKSCFPYWEAAGQRYTISESHLNEHSKLLVPDFEVVTFILTPK